MSATVGHTAPEFSLTAVHKGQFKRVSRDDYRGRWLVLFFYPMDFTFVCPTEILAFSDRINEFHNLNCDVLAASTDTQYCHLAWIDKPREQGGIQGLEYPLLADVHKETARSYGVLDEEEGVALRGLFLIDPEGVVQHATVNNKAVGRSVDETLRVLQAFQYVREYGEVCPANWEPGQQAMTPDWQQSKEYFANQQAGSGA